MLISPAESKQKAVPKKPMSSFIIERGQKSQDDTTPQGAKDKTLQVICVVPAISNRLIGGIRQSTNE